ncbi:MAG: hypothetical protein K2H47_12190 [Muribaculaceae bacterium]|nr:hypothetical protein [Muribaculaceae bacterium]
MIRQILISTALLGIAGTAAAETKYYTTDELSDHVAVSSNGRYVVATSTDDSYSYIWDERNPEQFKQVFADEYNHKIELYDITNDGTAVGAYYIVDGGTGSYQPCFVTEGLIVDLPNSPMAMYLNFAKCVTSDGSVIGGQIAYNDPESEVGMRFRPCFWRLNDDWEYDLELDPDVELPEHQGFITTCMNPEGTVLGGRLYCAAGSEVPALYKDNKIVFWNELETKIEPFYYKGEILGYYENYYIDGMKDGCKGDYLTGEFVGADAWGNFYGYRTLVDWVSEDGEDYELSRYAIIYNIAEDNMLDYPAEGRITAFSTGVGADRQYVFCDGNRMLVGDESTEEVKSISETFGFTNASTMTAVMSTSDDGRVLAGTRQEMHPATGEYMYYPFVVVLDEPLVNNVGVEVIAENKDLAVVISKGRIDFAGVQGEVYDLDGRLMGRGASVNLPAGIYVVKAGDMSRKVMVK